VCPPERRKVECWGSPITDKGQLKRSADLAVVVDTDGDGKLDNVDNCPAVAKPGSADWNSNNKGDACEDTDATLSWT
jgi:hypothetical protein